MYCLLGGQLFVLRGLSCLWRGLGYSSLEYDLSDIARQGVYLYYRDYVDVRRGFPIASCELCTGVDTGEDDAALPLLCPVHQYESRLFPLKSTSVGVFCLILAIYQLFTTYHDPGAREKAYSAALLIGIGSLLWVHLLWFLPLFWLGMYNFRSLTSRTFIASLLGVATVYWFLLGWCVWQRDFTLFNVPFSTLFKVRLLATDGIVLLDWISIMAIALLTVVASLNIVMHDTEDSLRSRQFLSFLIAMSVWAFSLYFLYEQASEEFLETACVPASILIAHFFTVTRGKIVFWSFFTTVAVLVATLFIRIWNFL